MMISTFSIAPVMMIAAMSPLFRYLGKESSPVKFVGANIEYIWGILFYTKILGMGGAYSLMLRIPVEDLSPL